MVAFGLNVPVPPLTTLHIPVPLVGMFPPSPTVVPLIQMVCDPPTVAVVGAVRYIITTSSVEAGHKEFEIDQRKV